jgi:hypothetical protein
MYNKIAVIYDEKDTCYPVKKIATTINHRGVNEIQYVPINLKDYKGTKPKAVLDNTYSVYLLLGTEVINAILGSVRGRSAAIKKDGIWYLTLNNPAQLYMENIAIKTAKQLIKAFTIIDNPEYSYPKISKYVLSNVSEVKDFVSEALKADMFSFDFETNNELLVQSPTFRATCLGICFTPNFTWIVPEPLLYDKEVVDVLSTLFSSNQLKIAHNTKFDLKILWHLGIEVRPRLGDTMLMSFILDENTPNGLKECIDEYLPELSGYDYGVDFVGDTERLYDYLSVDCHATLLLYCMFIKDIVEDEFFYPLYRNLYIPTMEVFATMEYRGAAIDVDYLDTMIEKIEGMIEATERELQNLPEVKKFVILQNESLVADKVAALQEKIDAKADPNNRYVINWQTQIDSYLRGDIVEFSFLDISKRNTLIDFLYTEKGLNLTPPMRDSGERKNGKPVLKPSFSTDAEALDDLDHEVTDAIKKIRSLKQLLSTFYVSIREKAINNNIYGGFKQTGAISGRSSSHSPNLQNLPSRVKIKELEAITKGVKKAFVAREGTTVLAADLSQAELRMIAHFSKDENMINAYLNNIDLHAITGARIKKYATVEEFIASDDY